jgi:D-alanyl-D-alanine carboxypeptidase
MKVTIHSATDCFVLTVLYSHGGRNSIVVSFGEEYNKTREEASKELKERIVEEGYEITYDKYTPVEFYADDVRDLFVF